MLRSINNDQQGFSLVEVILAIALFSLFAVALIGLLMNSYGSNFQAVELEKANLYAQQGLDAVWSIRRQAWNLLANGDYGLDNVSGYWQFSGSSDLLEDKYTRVVTIADACRDGSGDLVDCPGTTIDPHTKKATVKVTYIGINGVNNEVQASAYLTIWQSKDWIQTNWFNGPGQAIWASDGFYFIDDGNIDYSTPGEIKLKSLGIGGPTNYHWPFEGPANYSYNPAKIEVTGGVAQLKSESTPQSADSGNSGFDSGSGWSFYRWDRNWGEVRPGGSRRSSGGNPGGFYRITIPRGRNDEVGGWVERSFVVTEDSLNSVTLDFDWRVEQKQNADPITLKLYIFLDQNGGIEPVIGNEIWSSLELASGGTTSWASVNDIDVSSVITGSGTYYLKLAVWVETPGQNSGRFRLGYDNAKVAWTWSADSYPTDQPTIQPVTSWEPDNLARWRSFTEVANKNGGEIYYQLSNDNGATWQYWNGSSWASAIPTDYNIATEVNDNIEYFTTINEQIKFNAVFVSDGTQLVQLDDIDVEIFTPPPMETATTTADNTWQTVNLENTYINPVVIVSYQESNNSGPISARIRNALPDSFEVRLENPDGSVVSTDVINYLVIEEGEWVLGDAKIEAATYETLTIGRRGDWQADSQNYVLTYDSDPLVFHQLMSDNDPSWITTWVSRPGSRSNPPNTSGFQIGLNCAEACTAHGSTETIGWLVVENNITDSFEGVALETQRTNDSVRGHDNGCYGFSFNQTYTKLPIVFATQLEIDGNDGAWSVVCDLSNSQASFHAEEDQERDGERSHTTETFGFFVLAEELVITSGTSGYATEGWLESSAFNTGDASAFNFLSWLETIPSADEDIQAQLATSPNSGGPWTWQGPAGIGSFYTDGPEILIPLSNGHNDDQWIKYKVFLSGDGSDTPVLEEIKINYTP